VSHQTAVFRTDKSPVSRFPRRDAAHFVRRSEELVFAPQRGTSASLPADTSDQKSRRLKSPALTSSVSV
jgi:hypothetical protein